MIADASAGAIYPHPISSDQADAIPSSDACPACGHSEFLHQTVLTSFGSFVICHEETGDGECFRVRRAEGIPLGACRRDPP